MLYAVTFHYLKNPYKHPTVGFIVTGLVCGSMLVYAIWVWIHNFGWSFRWPAEEDKTPRELGEVK
jgi:hypothetical protein